MYNVSSWKNNIRKFNTNPKSDKIKSNQTQHTHAICGNYAATGHEPVSRGTCLLVIDLLPIT